MHIVDHIINPSIDFKVAYTFDAGPHAFLFMHEKVYEKVFEYFVRLYKWEKKPERLNGRGKELLRRMKE